MLENQKNGRKGCKRAITIQNKEEQVNYRSVTEKLENIEEIDDIFKKDGERKQRRTTKKLLRDKKRKYNEKFREEFNRWRE